MKEFFNELNVSALTLDCVVIFIVLYNVIRSAKRGFLSSLVGIGMLICSYFLVLPLSKVLSQHIYKLYFKDFFSQMIQNKLLEKKMDFQTILENLHCLKLDFSGLSLDLGKFGIGTDESLAEKINNISRISDFSDMLSDKIAYPFVNIFLNIIILILISFLFSILSRFFKKFFYYFSYVPVLGKINRFLGGIFGFFKSIFVIIFMLFIINGVIVISEDKFEFLNSETKNQTFLLKRCDEFVFQNKKLDFLKLFGKINC